MKVYSVYYDTSSMFKERGYEVVKDPKDCDLLILNGGEDISTSYYGEKNISRYAMDRDTGPSRRDKLEEDASRWGMENGKFLFGICRGAQLLNCLNGGKLWQHVDNHTHDHELIDLETGEQLKTTSLHHQMMIPTPEARIIAVASESTFKLNEAGRVEFQVKKDLAKGDDPEIVWYAKTRSLCIQGHPEYYYRPFTDYCFRVLDRVLASEKAAQQVAV